MACVHGRLGIAKVLLQQLSVCGGAGGVDNQRSSNGNSNSNTCSISKQSNGSSNSDSTSNSNGNSNGNIKSNSNSKSKAKSSQQQKEQQALDKLLLLVCASQTLPLVKLLLPWTTGVCISQALVAVAGAELDPDQVNKQYP